MLKNIEDEYGDCRASIDALKNKNQQFTELCDDYDHIVAQLNDVEAESVLAEEGIARLEYHRHSLKKEINMMLHFDQYEG